MTHPSRRRLPRRLGLLLAAPLVLGAAISTARADVAACRSQHAEPRAYLDCLAALQAAGERALERSVAGVGTTIEARADLQPAQRRRWIGLFEESQGRFVHWRNFECQSIAPFESEGPRQSVGGRLGGSGIMAQRMICLIGLNEQRARDLEARYAPEGGWPAAPPPAEPAEGSAAETGQPTAPATAPRIIMIAP
ncbi:lysozyme inhibitor LprI family protein [Ancylobacter sp. FA202]|uniref:lysozyme inhibitor LprI family protein n=1 Tax=Ancylobacter sp. FA202 TaxID=1111106 RepID=UPI0003687C49|nr:lysozyme inhibitor LprI family protein [Ancylobacter sp. FA202]